MTQRLITLLMISLQLRELIEHVEQHVDNEFCYESSVRKHLKELDDIIGGFHTNVC